MGKVINDWIADEFTTLNLGDARLNRRAEKLLSAMYRSPNASLPEACCGWADTNAAYRFFMNDAVSAPALSYTVCYTGTGRFGYHRCVDDGRRRTE